MTEQSLLKFSIAVTILLALFGIGAGLFSGSFAVVFDGVYALTDAFMTVLALLVARLIAAAAAPRPGGRLVERFTAKVIERDVERVFALNPLARR